MQRIRSYLKQVQNVFALIDVLTKQIYRTCAVFVAATLVVSVVSLSSNAFKGAGKNKVSHTATNNSKSETVGDEAEIEVDIFNVAMPEVETDTLEQTSIVKDVFLTADAGKDTVEIEMSEVTDVEPQAAISQVYTDTVAAPVFTSAVGNYSEEDLIALQRIVQAEAGGCDMVGKILVANVVINRRNAGGFGDTFTEVIFAKNQFSPVANGSYYTVTVSDETIEAVDRALSGEDYSQGALYFATTACVARGNFFAIKRANRLFEHDGHVFFGPK